MADLTVIILTKNEEKNIEKCINSVRACAKRVIVIDSYSDDKTVELAEKLGADIYKHTFDNHAAQFNWGLENIDITTEWIMRLDADEELTSELADEINRRLDAMDTKINGVILRRRVYFMGRWLKHGGKYPEKLLRVFRTGHGISEMKMMDEHLVVTDGEVTTFRYDFIDNNNKDLTWWINKHNWYSDKEAYDHQLNTTGLSEQLTVENTNQSAQAKRKRIIKNKGYYRLPKFFRARLYFIYRYYFRLGFLDGTEGRIYTFLQAYWYRYLVDAKLYESEKNKTEIKEQKELK